jgi:hypothetical protein
MQASGAQMSSEEIQALTDYYNGMSAQVQAMVANAQALQQYQTAANPDNALVAVASAFTAVNTELAAYGYTWNQINADIANGTATATELGLATQEANANFQKFTTQMQLTVGNMTTTASILTAHGQPVAAAQETANAIMTQIQQYASIGLNQSNSTQVQQLYQQFYAAQANVLSTQVSTTESLVQQGIEDNQISIAQGIQRLEVLKQQAEQANNPLMVEQLQTDIQNLINQGNQNAQFNLPSNLNIPTLYEVRRTEGTPATGSYNDNRQVSVQINIGSNADVQSGVSQLLTAIAGPSTTGYALPIT